MSTYLLLFAFIVGSGLITYGTDLYRTNQKKAIRNYIYVNCFVLALFSGLRNLGVGEDTYSYYLTYHQIEKESWKQLFLSLQNFLQNGEERDVGYPILVKFTQLFVVNFQFFLMLCAGFFYYALATFIKNNTNNLIEVILALSIFYALFYYVFSMTAIRQSLTMAATLFCYQLIKKKKLIPFLVIILLFSTIHKSVLIYIPFYFLCRIKSGKYLFSIILLLFPVLFIFKEKLTFLFLNIGGYDEYEKSDGAGTLTFTILLLVIAIGAYLRKDVILQKLPSAKNYFIAFGLAILLLPLSWVNPALLRITMYFSIFMILLIPSIMMSLQNYSQEIRRAVSGMSIAILFLFFFKAGYNKSNFEYRFYWEEVKLGKNYE